MTTKRLQLYTQIWMTFAVIILLKKTKECNSIYCRRQEQKNAHIVQKKQVREYQKVEDSSYLCGDGGCDWKVTHGGF